MEMNWISFFILLSHRAALAVSRQFVLQCLGSPLVVLIYCRSASAVHLPFSLRFVSDRYTLSPGPSHTSWRVVGISFVVRIFQKHLSNSLNPIHAPQLSCGDNCQTWSDIQLVTSILLIFKNLENNRTEENNWLTKKHPCFVLHGDKFTWPIVKSCYSPAITTINRYDHLSTIPQNSCPPLFLIELKKLDAELYEENHFALHCVLKHLHFFHKCETPTPKK